MCQHSSSPPNPGGSLGAGKGSLASQGWGHVAWLPPRACSVADLRFWEVLARAGGGCQPWHAAVSYAGALALS